MDDDDLYFRFDFLRVIVMMVRGVFFVWLMGYLVDLWVGLLVGGFKF